MDDVFPDKEGIRLWVSLEGDAMSLPHRLHEILQKASNH